MSAGRQWDSAAGRHRAAYERRWLVEWYTWKSEEARENVDGLLEDDQEHHERTFPTRGLAAAFARRFRHPLLSWRARLVEQVFMPNENGPGIGWWENHGPWEEPEPE